MEQEKQRKSERRNRGNKGSMTVEAAFLVPVLFYLLIGVIYLEFWLYDQTVAQALCCQTAWQLQYEDGTEEELTAGLEQKLQNVLITDSVQASSCAKQLVWSQAECNIKVEIPFTVVRELLGNTAGYEDECVGIVSGLANETVFRKLWQAERTDQESQPLEEETIQP